MSIELALYQPDMPQNTGTVMRMCACFGVRLHIIHPTGFMFSRQALRRSGLDYLEHVDLVEHDSFSTFNSARIARSRRLVLLTTRARQSVYLSNLESRDILLMGRESAGVPDAVVELAELSVRIPMRLGLRSLNVAVAAGMVLGEALRQTDAFKDMT